MSAPYTISKVLDVPGIRHGFFGREGGRSQGDLAGNNMSISQGDNPDLVVSNRSSAANAMGGYDIKDLVVFRQTHSTTVVTLTERPDRTVAIEADAMVTNRPDLLLGILTADCAPVLLADAEAGVVGAAHAGWRGAVAGVNEATVAAMEKLGARRERIAAAIGPAIAARNYEVDQAFKALLVGYFPDNERFFGEGPAGKPHFDLEAYIVSRLAAAGIAKVEAMRLDTYADPDRFFSYRRATHRGEPDYGRQISLVGIAGGNSTKG
jgi:purine-nucleoside/S-methyl-5'-thioadenosine phosphorylase / adenosine deaminase